VYSDVDLSFKGLSELPLKFGKVGTNFYCRRNQLTTLEGASREVGGRFYCLNNPLHKLILDNKDMIKEIIKYQEDYSILDEFRFREMMRDI
jgi:hypothetical protein